MLSQHPGIAIGLMMMVTTEGKVGGVDLQNNVAYHNAEGGVEKMTSDLAACVWRARSPRETGKRGRQQATLAIMAGIVNTLWTLEELFCQ